MRQLYLYQMKKTSIKNIVFNKLIESNDTKELADVISLWDFALQKELKESKLSPIPENKEINFNCGK